MIEQFQVYQQILFDLTANYLEPLPTAYGRLAYLGSLRDGSSNRYVHEGLVNLYGAEPVNQVIGQCHEEVFERLLEMPLNAQGEELRSYLDSLPGAPEESARVCRERCAKWIPPRAPSYLKELYDSNLKVLLELLRDDTSTAHPNN